MSLETARRCIDWIFENIPLGLDGVAINFIGGEPLLEFELIQQIYEYASLKEGDKLFFATTNGTIRHKKMKKWFYQHRENFVLGLSLDGKPLTHNHNRNNSFSKIDIDFFLKTWPHQGIKMTLSEFSLNHLAEDIIFLHSLGFKEIRGVNIFEGNFDWSASKFIEALIPQLEKLVEFYVENDKLEINQMLGRSLEICEIRDSSKKWCGIGSGAIFFDTDGTKLPCPFVTPMTFSKEELENIGKTDFYNENNFIDDDCFLNCYIYPICPNCAGANYLTQKSFKMRDKSKCKLQKLITLYVAELFARRIVKNPNSFDEARLYHLINAIKKIKTIFLPEFEEYIK